MRSRSASRVSRNRASCSGSLQASDGSGRGQWRRRTPGGVTGQTSSAQSVITVSAEATGTSVTAFDRAPEMSSPASARTRTAIGCTCQGWEPALSTRTPGGASALPKASANWLRAELARQRNTTR